ncbi:MAG: hypothetical protein HY481_02455 [Candidatus Vogelbacteria bacterium]|nr:hypothetical protein [Candidatus Vogelbacteria bacterium]
MNEQTSPAGGVASQQSESPRTRWFIIAILLLAALGLGAWVWSNYALAPAPVEDTNIEPPAPVAPINGSEIDTANWKTYRNEEFGFEFKYPTDYVAKAGTANDENSTYVFAPDSLNVFKILVTPGGEFGYEYNFMFSGEGQSFKQILSTFRFIK